MNNHSFLRCALTALSLLLVSGAFAADIPDRTATFQCIADTWIRENNITWKGGAKDGAIELNTLTDDAGNKTYFVGLYAFDFQVPEGMKVKEATLHLVTERVKDTSNQTVDVYPFLKDFDEEGATWQSESSYVSVALRNAPTASFTAAGQKNKAIYDTGISAAYQNLDAWTNDVDLTYYLQRVPKSTARVNLMLRHDGNNQIKFFSKDNTGVEKAFSGTPAQTNLKAADLMPLLTVTFTEDIDSHEFLMFEKISDTEAAVIGCEKFDDYMEIKVPSVITFDGVPFTVTTIAYRAFYNNQKITKITLPASVTVIGEGAFGYMNKMQELNIPSSVVSIGPWAFYSNTMKNEIVLPTTLNELGANAFDGCSASLFDLSQATQLTEIPVGCFQSTKGEIIFHDGITSIGATAFINAKQTTLQLPTGLREIGESCFSQNYFIDTLEIPEGVSRLEPNTFYASYIRCISLPSTMEWISATAFDSARKLEEVTCLASEVPATDAERSPFPFNAEDGLSAVEAMTLTVYESALAAYTEAADWTAPFGSILTIPDPEIEEPTDDPEDPEIDDPEEPDTSGIAAVSEAETQAIFDLFGRPLSRVPQSGFYIRGGKLCVAR